MNCKSIAGLAVAGGVVLLFGGAVEPADTSDGSAARRSGVEARADEALRRMSTFLGSARELTFEATTLVDQVLDNGQKIQLSDRLEFSLRRPDRITGRLAGDTRDELVWYNGTALTLYDRLGGTFGKLQVPTTIEQMLDHLASQYGIVMPLAELFFSDSYRAMTEDIWSGVYAGLHQVQGVKCHHLAFRQSAVDWQIWIEDGAAPWPRKLVITYRETPGQPQYIALLDRWNRTPRLADEAFREQIPDGTREVALQRVLESRSRPAGDRAGKTAQ